MDKEIQSLEQKIVELNEDNEQLKKIIEEYESKNEKPKGKNELFCELCSSFTEKKIKSLKIKMIIGMYIKRYDKEMEKKYGKFMNQEKILKKKIADLISELHMSKYGKEIPSEMEDNQKENNIIENEIIAQSEGENGKIILEKKEGNIGFRAIVTNRMTSQGITRVVNSKTTTQEFKNAAIEKNVIQTSFKRRNEK